MLDHSQDSREAKAKALRLRYRAVIGGRSVDSASGDVFDSINPAPGDVLVQVAACDAPDVDRAVAAARRVIASWAWSLAAPSHRKEVLLRLVGLICENPGEWPPSTHPTWAS